MSDELIVGPDIAVCPCGQIPEKLIVEDSGQGGKWAMVNGYCCGEWNIEFRTNYTKIGSEENNWLARQAWNAAPRGKGG